MKTENFAFNFMVYDSIDELRMEDADLLTEARNATKFAYAPYSRFRVGAAAVLVNGQKVTGTNQENASFPAGICAERTLLSTASSLFPGIGIDRIAISYDNTNGSSDHPISPCGICRQSFVEFQQRTQHPISIILSGLTGKVLLIENATNLLPFCFSSDDMQNENH